MHYDYPLLLLQVVQDLRAVCADLTSASGSATSQSATTASPPVGGQVS